ncbi:hypothetical protein CsSME_00008770 [Camellia sinensis var. sinensis]
MDWFSWLSKSGLNRSLTYEYGLIFTRNELEEEDLKSFNHEFLQSMGISVAKHRLEILKLARKEVGDGPRSARKSFKKSIGKWALFRDSDSSTVPELTPFQAHWTGALRKHHSSKEFSQEKVMVTNRSIMRSGPLDRRTHERMMVTSRSLCVSGPLDGKMQERSINRSPVVSGPLDSRVQERLFFVNKSPDMSWPLEVGDLSPRVNNHYGKEKMVGDDDGIQPLWSLLFQDIKPT